MHITYIPEDVNFWLEFYKTSVSSNPQYQLGGVLPGFRGYAPYHHRGAGIGSFFKSLYRMVLPMLKTVGKEALLTGSKVAADVASGENFKSSLKTHGKNALSNALHKTGDHIVGAGLGKRKTSRSINKVNKRSKNVKKSSVKQNKSSKSVVSDIFSNKI